VVARRTCIALWSLFSMCGIHLTQTFHFPKLLVRKRYTLAGEILTSVATAVHEMLHTHSRTDFTCFMWHSSVVDVGAPLQETSSFSSQGFLAFSNQQTVLHEATCVPKPSLKDLQHSRAFLPKNSINVFMSLCEKLPCGLS